MAPLENELAWKLAASLADRIGGERYELYFDQQSFTFEHGRLLVQAADEFTLERIRSQFAEPIRETVTLILGADIKVVYCVYGEAPEQKSLFPELEMDKVAAPAKPFATETEVTTAALSQDNTIQSKKSSLDPWFLDSTAGEHPAAENFTRRDSAVLAKPADSRQVGRLASAVKRQTEDRSHGQLNLFETEFVESNVAAGEPKTRVNPVEKTANEACKSNQMASTYSTGNAELSLVNSENSKQYAKPSLPGSRAAMTLATYQFGEDNRLAKAAIEQVLQRPGLISPVVIHGPVGSGKSHLATGLGQQLRGTFRSFSILQLSAEQFTSRFLEALNGSGLPSLRAKFREMDMLVLEDIQFFQNKKATIIELQHTLDALIKTGKQVVLTADRHPNDLTFLGSEVQTRLVSGLVVSLNPADREARAQICRQWCARQGMRIEESLVQWMADHIVGDVRRLSGALFRILAIQLSTGEMITSAKAMDLLSDYVSASHSICSLGQIQKVICDVCGVDAKDLNGSKRTRRISSARMLAMFLARKHTQAALSEIGDYFGGRRHSTVLAAEKRIKGWEQSNELMETGMQALNTREVIRKVEAKLRAM